MLWAMAVALTVLGGVSQVDSMDAVLSYKLSLWYRQPAKVWTEALPVGNGRLGAMVFGGVASERIQLNEKNLWSGGPQDADNPEAYQHLEEVRQLLHEGKYVEAQRLTQKTLVCRGPGSGAGAGANVAFGCYQTLGDLRLTFHNGDEPVTDYVRSLNLDTAAARVRYRIGDVCYVREVFCSAVDDVLVVHLSCDKPGRLAFDLGLSRDPASASHEWKNDSGLDPFTEGVASEPSLVATVISANHLRLRGKAWNGKGMTFQADVMVLTDGGHADAMEKGIRIQGANSATLILTAATDYAMKYPDYRGDDPSVLCDARLGAAAEQDYASLYASHLKDYQTFFTRVGLDLDSDQAANVLPTDERLRRVINGATDDGLVALYFQYGRYLLISSLRGTAITTATSTIK